jgi:hypothetical protein
MSELPGPAGTIDGFVVATIAPWELQPTSAPAARTIASVPARMIGMIVMIQVLWFRDFVNVLFDAFAEIVPSRSQKIR